MTFDGPIVRLDSGLDIRGRHIVVWCDVSYDSTDVVLCCYYYYCCSAARCV